MRERVTVVTLSVCHFILEKAPFFRVENLHKYILGDNLGVLNVALF